MGSTATSTSMSASMSASMSTTVKLCLVASLCLALCTRPAQAGPQLNITAELGPELDTNATRLQVLAAGVDAPVTSGLMRLVARGSLGLRLGQRHFVSLEYGGGGKLFWTEDAQSANELVQHLDLAWAVRLPAGVLWVNGSYYDAFQQQSERDFRTGHGGLRFTMSHTPPNMEVNFHLGYRGLQYKPLESYDFQGPLGGVNIKWALTSGDVEHEVDWTLGLSYTAAHRSYTGMLMGLREKCPPSGDGSPSEVCIYPKDSPREDLNMVARAEVNYLGNADATLWYAAEINTSNSFGETYVRHAVGIKFTAPLLWGVFFTARGVLQLADMLDPYSRQVVQNLTFVNIEEENRTRLSVQFSRDLVKHWSLNLRYSLFVNESTSTDSLSGASEKPTFLRQTLFLGVRFDYEN